WNMVGAVTTSTTDVVDALRAGRSYAVLRTGAVESAQVAVLKQVTVSDNTLTVTGNGAEATFNFVGQNGAIRKSVKNATAASYTLKDGDTYVRTVITSPQTILYLNPVIRYDGRGLPRPAATVDMASTWALRAGTGLTLGLLGGYGRRRRIVQPIAEPVLTAKRNIA